MEIIKAKILDQLLRNSWTYIYLTKTPGTQLSKYKCTNDWNNFQNLFPNISLEECTYIKVKTFVIEKAVLRKKLLHPQEYSIILSFILINRIQLLTLILLNKLELISYITFLSTFCKLKILKKSLKFSNISGS